MKRVLVVRQDNNGDVLLIGPAVRAIAHSRAEVHLLCSARGVNAARMLPGVADVLVAHSPWIDAEPQPVVESAMIKLIKVLRATCFDEAIIFTSFHQSPLPTALLARMAGIPRIGAISVDYPGSLLDVRHHVEDNIHEVDRNLSLAQAMGYELDATDDRAMSMNFKQAREPLPFGRYVVVHPGATVSARTLDRRRFQETVELLAQSGRRVVLTGSGAEAGLTAAVAGTHPNVLDMGGRTSFAEFAAIVRDAQAVICGNTATAHVASAVGTPVVSIFPPTVPAVRFRPWMIRHVLLGDQHITCAGCRARECPFDGHPCLADVTPERIVQAFEELLGPVPFVFARRTAV